MRDRFEIMGDLPIFVAHDSADVWAQPELFRLDARRPADRPRRRAARLLQRHRPAVGQSAYRWDVLARTRIRAGGSSGSAPSLALVDCVRLDHFRGFEASWEVPASEPTAVNGVGDRARRARSSKPCDAALGRRCRSWPRTSGVITPEVERCATSSASRG